jgi:hypothetical protein
MKYATYILVPLIVLCMSLIALLVYSTTREGFANGNSEYSALQTRLSTTMAPYCAVASYVQSQMKVIYTAIGESEAQAAARIEKTYADVYACKDEDASSRPSCSGQSSNSRSDSNPGFIPCATYLNLPTWNSSDNGQAAAIALSAIPDDLADRTTKEVDWYSQIIAKLQKTLDSGNNPPSTPPDSETSPAKDSSGRAWSSTPNSDGFSDYRWDVEGFSGTMCSPSQIVLAAQAAKVAQASSCTIPKPDGQIARVNAILNSRTLKAALAKCASLQRAMVKLQSDQQKAKDGTLYDWQNDGPKKTYKTFPTGDRSTNFLSSMQQNQ